MAKAIEAGIPKLHIEEAAARTQARIDAGEQTVVGVNKYRNSDETKIDILKVDNSAVRASQIEKLKRLKAERDPLKCQEMLDRLSAVAKTGEGNLLAAAVDAARAKATVGEISLALEKVWNRHVAKTRVTKGIYVASSRDMQKIEMAKRAVMAFKEADGRPPRILVAKMGQDGHDRGQKVIASAFADMGFDVKIGALFSTPEEVAALGCERKRAYGWHLDADRRAPQPYSPAQGRAGKGGAGRHHDRGGRRHSAGRCSDPEGHGGCGGVSAWNRHSRCGPGAA